MSSTTNRSSTVVSSAQLLVLICPRNTRRHGVCLRKWSGTTRRTGKDHWYVLYVRMSLLVCPSVSLCLYVCSPFSLWPVWARERCRISSLCFLAECHKRILNQGSFVLLYSALFAFSGLCLVFFMSVFLICLLSCIFQHEPT